jgi:uncharacterized protein (TIGR03905 family)
MNRKIEYIPKKVCSRKIIAQIDDNNNITNVEFVGGCQGNTQGVAKLCIGRNIDEVIETLKGIPCGIKGTSCPDQLSIALTKLKEQSK